MTMTSMSDHLADVAGMPVANAEQLMTADNPCGIQGLAFLEFAGRNDEDAREFERVFTTLGLAPKRILMTADKADKKEPGDIVNFQCQRIHFLYNSITNGFGENFARQHGQSACGIAFDVADPVAAHAIAIERGARNKPNVDLPYPAVEGVGGSAIYFVCGFHQGASANSHGFSLIDGAKAPEGIGFEFVDHLTNNVEKGKKDEWSNFYKGIFGFTELQYFDIQGEKTGLVSDALQAPSKNFCIPINEAKEEKSQIAEYIREYKGAGIQHIALHSSNLLASLDQLDGQLPTLDIDDDYYDTVFERVKGVTEDREHIMRHQVLVDGDPEGYLLQIFTQNTFGPIFFEFIQRKQHDGFGHGNFGALFKSIERDQERRGVL